MKAQKPQRKVTRVEMKSGKSSFLNAFKMTSTVVVMGMLAGLVLYQSHVISKLHLRLDEVKESHEELIHRVRRDVEGISTTTGKRTTSATSTTTTSATTTTNATTTTQATMPTTSPLFQTTTTTLPPLTGPPETPQSVVTPATISTGSGTTYIHWGKLSCSGPATETVYSGAAGGSNSNTEGGGVEYLCMPMDPQWGSYNEVVDGAGELFGVEFEMNNFPFLLRSHGPESLRSHNMPCAVCNARGKSSVLMIPARVDCYPGWTREYHGYLVSGHTRHKGRSMFACVDQMPDVEPAGYRRDTSAAVYHVDARCGSLPCPPYFEGRELACTVCTK